jgi:uncharacterized membrane protein
VLAAIEPFLAHTGGLGHMSGWGSGWMIGAWLLLIPAGALVAWAFRSGDAGRPSRKPMDILAERFAGGEISRSEYEEARDVLTGDG